MDKIYPVYTLKNECADCYKCVRNCYVKAIKIEDGHASVIANKCVSCGKCVSICPSGAKRVRNDYEKVKNILIPKNGVRPKVYASLAPSFWGLFNNVSKEKIIAALKLLGFCGVSETALGAQAVSIKTAQILAQENSPQKLYISSACPVVADYIRLYHPKFVKNITPIASPALTHARMLKDKFGEDIKVVFIGPCIAKKNESDSNPDLLYAALTFNELKLWLKEECINFDDIEINEENFALQNACEGTLYPIEGGMNETIKKSLENYSKCDTDFLNISSLSSINKLLCGFDENKLKNKLFIETLACSGGCLSGPAADTKKSGLDMILDVKNKVQYRKAIPKEPDAVVKIDYKADEVKNQEFSYEEIRAVLKKIGKNSPEDELNCGGCGYSSCYDMGLALLRHEAEPMQCASYMRQIAHRKADALLRCMPSAMVMVDSEMKIVETNEAFIRMFAGDMYDVYSNSPELIKGAQIGRIIDFETIFKEAISSYKDVHKEHYPLKGKLYDIVAFAIEKDELAGAIIADVTDSNLNREKIAQKAHEVINKNISIVQNIACLLGEHMVETELLLSSIAKDYDKESDETEEK